MSRRVLFDIDHATPGELSPLRARTMPP